MLSRNFFSLRSAVRACTLWTYSSLLQPSRPPPSSLYSFRAASRMDLAWSEVLTHHWTSSMLSSVIPDESRYKYRYTVNAINNKVVGKYVQVHIIRVLLSDIIVSKHVQVRIILLLLNNVAVSIWKLPVV